MTAQRILIVDDEAQLQKTIRAYLEREGYAVESAMDGAAALAAAAAFRPDLVILDVMLPGLGGFAVLETLRQQSGVYVLMLTARAEEIDKVMGLTLGADDYMTKPFDFDEFLARIEALGRRGRGAVVNVPPVAQVGDITIERDAKRVRKAGQVVELTSKEYQLLELLLSEPGKVFSRPRILNRIWGYDTDPLTNVVDVYIRRLRAKLQWDSDSGHIRTVRNYGYSLDP